MSERPSLVQWVWFGLFVMIAYGWQGNDSYQLAREKESIQLIPVIHDGECKQFIAQRTLSTEPWNVKAVCAQQKGIK